MDLLVALAWLGSAAVLSLQPSTRRWATLAAVFAATWLLGSAVPELVLLHRGALAHVVLAYPHGRLGSMPAHAAVAAAYVAALAADDAPAWTIGYALALAGAAGVRMATATGSVRRSRAVPAGVAVVVAAILCAGAAADLDVLLAYQLALVLGAVVATADLRTARWAGASIAGLVLDLGPRPVGGVMRDRLARAVGDPTLEVAYVLDELDAPVDEHGVPVELPAGGTGRSTTAVELGGRRLAVLIHDPAAVTDAAATAGAASAFGVALANARLQADVRRRLSEVEASTRRLVDAAAAERRRLAADLRAHVDPLLERAAAELGDHPLRDRVAATRDELFRLAAGLDPPSLAEHGLDPALRELARHAGLPTVVEVPGARFPAAVETCVWFTCAEGLANALKHAGATRLEIRVRRRGPGLRVEVVDDGIGGADAARGSGLRRLGERVRAAGGELAVHSRPGHGTRVVADLHVGAGA